MKMLASSVNFKHRKFFANDNIAVRNVVEQTYLTPWLENKFRCFSIFPSQSTHKSLASSKAKIDQLDHSS